jgi:hypothetical protein
MLKIYFSHNLMDGEGIYELGEFLFDKKNLLSLNLIFSIKSLYSIYI